MKILILTPCLDVVGGIANYYKIWKTHDIENIYQYFYIGRRPKEKLFFTFIRLLGDYFFFFIKLLFIRYDLIVANPGVTKCCFLREGLFLAIASLFRIPRVVFYHGWVDNFDKAIIGSAIPFYRLVYLRTQASIVLVSACRDLLKALGYKGVIHQETMCYSERNDGNTIASGNGDHINILFLTRMRRDKGAYITIDSFDIVSKKYPHVRLTMAGDGPERREVEEYVSGKGISNVRFIGSVQDVEKEKAYSNADIYILPSFSEGFPNTVVEAMSYGLPIVSRPVGGLVDFFVNDKMGYLCDSKAPEEFAHLLEKLISSPQLRIEIGRHNRDYAEKHFRSSVVFERLNRFYISLVNG